MSVTRYFYKKLEDGSMSKTPTHLGAKAEYITIRPAEGEELLNAQSEFERMWQMDAYLENKIDTEITDRKNAITEEAIARQNADNTLQGNIAAEAEARDAAVKTERQAREAAINNVLKALADEIVNRNNAISNTIEELNLPDRFNKLADDITALEEKLLYTADADTVAITEDTVLNLSEETYKYILIYCEYNGKRMPVYQVLADGASSEVIYHSLTEDGVCYISMNMLVSENTLAISNIINSNDTAEFKILNIYGCV